MSISQDFCIRIVPREEQVAALWLLFGSDPEPARRNRVQAAVKAAQQRTLDFDFFLEARRGDSRLGVVWGQRLPGRNANIWPPFLAPHESDGTADLLQAELDRRLTEAGLVMAQALVPPTAKTAEACLERSGYSKAASLLYLISGGDQLPEEWPAGPLEFESYEENQFVRLRALIEQTYIDSRDAPSLDGLREIDDVIEGYKATGQFAPQRWFFVRYQNEDIGCLLLTYHPMLQQCELIYMGLVPSARGKGWGKELVRFGQWQARCAGCDSLLVSVDAANEPALVTYARCGFSELDRREVWVKEFAAAS